MRRRKRKALKVHHATMCIDFSMVSASWMSSLAAVLVCPLDCRATSSPQSFPVRSGIHDAICHCASRQRIASFCRAGRCRRISGTDTCAEMSRSQSMVNRRVICPNGAMDAQSVYHQPWGNWYFLLCADANWNKKKKHWNFFIESQCDVIENVWILTFFRDQLRFNNRFIVFNRIGVVWRMEQNQER